MTRGSITDYNADFNRNYKEEATFSALGVKQQVKETTYYVGKEYEKIVTHQGIKHRYTISTGGGTVQIERDHNTDHDKPKYLLTDNLGSTNVILNGLAQVEQRLEFDPWGMRMAGPQVGTVNSITNKGYTGHEMDDEVGVINMNARIYDPYLGRFLSADPVLPDAGDLQAFNRYSYVLGNHLKYVDPTGNNAVYGMFGDIAIEGENSMTTHVYNYEVIGEPSPDIIPVVREYQETSYTYKLIGVGYLNNDYNGERESITSPFHFQIARSRIVTHTVVIDFTNGTPRYPNSQSGSGGGGGGDDPLSEESLKNDNLKQFGRDILRNVWREVTDPIRDAREGRILKAGCGIIKVCRGLKKVGELGGAGARKVFKKAQEKYGSGRSQKIIKPKENEGVIYRVPGSKTESGKPYIGRSDDLTKRAKSAKDGRDRTDAEIIGTYPKGDTKAARIAEQKAINQSGGVPNLDNKRNEIAPKKWKDHDI